ncbi:MAG: hypothetical protein E6R03_06880 [Hyphomicrobiaceae bacterium]|nr:MAG: hypothetical protein E6R03_06880 [Hyphomicrobiaceae bacterium]
MAKNKSHIEWALSQGTPSQSQIADIIKQAKERKFVKHKPLKKEMEFGVVLSDIHFPKHDPVVWDIALQFIADTKPDAVWLAGDICDLGCVSRHEKAPGDGFTLMQELAIANMALDELSNAIGPREVDLMFVDGNHEDRIPRYLASGRCPPELRDMVQQIPEALALEERGYLYVGPDEQPIQIGELAVFHGEWYGKNHAAKHADELGANCIYGHTHRPQIYTKQTLGGPIIATGMPCMRKLQAEWQHQRNREFTGWISGFTVLEWVDGFAHPRFVFVIDGKAVWNRKVYEGRYEVE